VTPPDAIYVEATRHTPLTVGIHHSPLAAAGHARFVERGMTLHLTAVEPEPWKPAWRIELRAADDTVLRTAQTASTNSDEDLTVIAEWIADQAAFTATELPDQTGMFGIQHTQTGQWIARWDGAPARWASHTDADTDVDLVNNRIAPQRSLDTLPVSDWWRQS
jgi:hypothetical protein